ncbi:MAG: DUF1559 domain-containing protein, partial [Proteobacteria bacterium]
MAGGSKREGAGGPPINCFSPLLFRRTLSRGFTLIEILVVIAVVALLAAVLLPVFNRVKATGRRATCASNLRQIGMALSQYAQDTRFYPRIDPNAFNDGKRCSPWADKIFPYLKSERVFECPSFEYGAYRSDCPAPDKSDPEHPISFSGSYDLNFPESSYKRDLESGEMQMGVSLRPISALRWTRPSSTILVLDGRVQR